MATDHWQEGVHREVQAWLRYWVREGHVPLLIEDIQENLKPPKTVYHKVVQVRTDTKST